MKIKIFNTLLLIAITAFASIAQSIPQTGQLGKENNWTKKMLMEPSALASVIRNPKAKKPLIFNIGVVQDIKGAKNMGAASEKKNLVLFTNALKKLPKSSTVVVYCGCCPFDKCPNIRPAIKALKEGGFINARLLNLPANIKTDWISKGYPMAQ